MAIPDQTQTAKKSYWHNPSNYVALFTLLAVLTYTAFQIWQTFLTRSNNVVSQRAFLFFDQPSVTMVLDAKDQTKNVQFGVPIVNGGNTATKNMTLSIRCAPSTDSLPEPWVPLYREPLERIPQVIGPHQSGRAFCDFKLDQVRDMRDGKLHGYLMGEVTYKDRLDDSIIHHTQFAWELADINLIDPTPQMLATLPNAPPNILLALKPRGVHNCADEECSPDAAH